jgi:hypothetical protein
MGRQIDALRLEQEATRLLRDIVLDARAFDARRTAALEAAEAQMRVDFPEVPDLEIRNVLASIYVRESVSGTSFAEAGEAFLSYFMPPS